MWHEHFSICWTRSPLTPTSSTWNLICIHTDWCHQAGLNWRLNPPPPPPPPPSAELLRRPALWPLCKQSNPHWFSMAGPELVPHRWAFTSQVPVSRAWDVWGCCLHFLVLVRRCGLYWGGGSCKAKAADLNQRLPLLHCLVAEPALPRARAFLSSILSAGPALREDLHV